MKRRWRYALVILVMSLLAGRELGRPGFFETHDGVIHVMRLAHFDQALRNGQLPVRWLPTWMAGYGSPVFNFNWSLPYYVGSGLHFLGISYENAVKLIFLVTIPISGLCMYSLLRSLNSDRWGSVAGSIAYVWAPYRFADIFVRGALGEAASFIFVPLIIASVIKAYQKGGFPWWTPLLWGLFILTHNVMAILTAGVYLGYALYTKITQKAASIFLLQALWVFAIGVGLAGFFWLPAVFEKKYDQVSHLKTIYEYREHFVPFMSLLDAKWQYGLSLPNEPAKSMAFQVGWVHLVAFVTSGIWLLRLHKQKNFVWKQLLFFSTLFLAAFFMILPNAWPIYAYTPLGTLMNFPWRFLEITTFAASVLVGLLLTGKRALAITVILAVTLISWQQSRIITPRFTKTDSWYQSSYKAPNGNIVDSEYLPIWANYFGLLDHRGPAYDPFFVSKTATVMNSYQKNLTYTTSVTCEQTCQIQAQQFYFPGWKVYIDGQESEVKPDEFGLVSFEVATGTHLMTLTFTDTQVRQIGTSISLASLIFYLLPWLFHRRKNLYQMDSRVDIDANKTNKQK